MLTCTKGRRKILGTHAKAFLALPSLVAADGGMADQPINLASASMIWGPLLYFALPLDGPTNFYWALPSSSVSLEKAGYGMEG